MDVGGNRAVALYNHILALERLDEVKRDASADFNERRALAKEDGFDTNVIASILKRRRNGDGQTKAFDELLEQYEAAIETARERDREISDSAAEGVVSPSTDAAEGGRDPACRGADPAPAHEIESFENEGGAPCS